MTSQQTPYPPSTPDQGRLLPERAFPSYRFIPGLGLAHPLRDARGHSYTGKPEPEPVPCPAADEWHQTDEYLYGIDLYNHGYFWEAHEAWEYCWRGTTKGSKQHCFLQGLIQAAAACLQRLRGSESGALKLAERARGNLELAACDSVETMGIQRADFAERLTLHFRDNAEFPFIVVVLPR